MSTVFVTLCDAVYYPRALQTIRELRTRGSWTGDVCLIAVDFDPEPMDRVQIVRTTHLPTDALVDCLRRHPIRPMDDNRHFAKLHQWDKLQVFKSSFRAWERVVFLDAGIRIFDSVQPLLDLDWRGKFLAPDDSDPYDNGVRFRVQLDMAANPDAASKVLSDYPETILDEHYFLNCIFVFDTALLGRVSFEEMEEAMNRYPICMCNEMGIMNLIFSFKLRVWEPFPQKVGDKYLFGWSERNYREGPTWEKFHFLKYSFTA